MDNLGAEVSAKIRSAIKAKLIELDAYVDDELPDYIMVMVANDRTKEQMEEDLGLFLNENTVAFTTWLHSVLEKLRKVTMDEVAKKEVAKKKKKPKKEKEKEPKKEKTKEKVKEKDKSRERDKKKKTAKEAGEPKKKEKEKRAKKQPGGVSSGEAKNANPQEAKNANLQELGTRHEKKAPGKIESGGGDKEGGYDAEAILKNAVKSSAKALKVSSPVHPDKPVKKTTEKKKEEKRKTINLKEDAEFYKVTKPTAKRRDANKERSRSPRKSRSYSRERKGRVASQVQVVKSKRSHRSHSDSSDGGYDPEKILRKSVASKAILPPRPSRPNAREDRGVARALTQSIIAADRSILSSRKRVSSPPLAYRRHSPQQSRSPDSRRRSSPEKTKRKTSGRRMSRDRLPRLSPGDIERFNMIKAHHQTMTDRRRKEELKAELKRRRGGGEQEEEEELEDYPEVRKIKRKGGRPDFGSRTLAMDEEIQKRRRASSLDRELREKKEFRGRKPRLLQEEEEEEEDEEVEEGYHDEEEEVRIIVRRDISPEPLLLVQREITNYRAMEGEEELLVEEEEEEEEEEYITPPKKFKRADREEYQIRRLEHEDAELLEMRRKALESLMKRTTKGKGGGDGRQGKIIIPLDDNSSTSSSDSDSHDSDSEASMSQRDKSGRRGVEGVEEAAEPTFIVTMEGIDEKYFQQSRTDTKQASKRLDESSSKPPQKNVLQPPGKTTAPAPAVAVQPPRRADVSVAPQPPRRADVSVTPQPPRRADVSVAPQPPRRADVSVSASPAKRGEPSVAVQAPRRADVATVSAPTIRRTGVAVVGQKREEQKAAAKVTPVNTKQTAVAKPVAAKTSPSKPVTAKPSGAVPIKRPITAPPSGTPTAPTVRKIAAIKPSVSSQPITKKESGGGQEETKPKKKFTPITAPKQEATPTIISLKPKYQPISFSPHPLPPPSIKSKTDVVCMYYPMCKRGDFCIYRHPAPVEVLQTTNKYRWSAR